MMRGEASLKYGRRLSVSVLLAGLAAASLPFLDTPTWFNVVVAVGMVSGFNAIAICREWPAEQRASTTLLQSLVAALVSIVVFVGLKACELYLSRL